MRKSAYGPIRCDRCGFVMTKPDLTAIAITHSVTVCMHCLTAIERTRFMAKLVGVCCLFCGRQMKLPELIDHFNREHGRVVANW